MINFWQPCRSIDPEVEISKPLSAPASLMLIQLAVKGKSPVSCLSAQAEAWVESDEHFICTGVPLEV